MYPLYYAIIIVLSVIALISTIVIAKNMDKSENQLSPEEDLQHLKSDKNDQGSIPLLSAIYAVTFVITVILVWIFIF
ncbi:hypothetical protein GLW04_15730 [Halobacillus litoralis]|uniref:Uncharacterized protein n=1 Tax=Halobacillus litoralis TaxID=45668 RepID=A0A845DYG2_9BACI|nr:hypothetical protein [Halobacillus litoralis]MCA1022275.1 hypothetical protein [Halobacillus litoralis]MYL21352.1 hypothetical protein [Halobacillus litoralis]MYL38196.1 hypothetical protein [Halobacillus litoralis]